MEKLSKLIEDGNMNLKSMIDCIDKRFYFRTMKSTLNFMKHRYRDNTICYCHNLNAELTSILAELKGNDIKNRKKINAFGINPSTSVFRDKNTPLSVTLQEMPNITFKCSYALTSKGIKTLGEEFTKEFKKLGYNIDYNKLEYDYEKYRSPLAERTQQEKEYNERDVDISLLAIIKECIIRKCSVEKLPLTFTAGIKRDRNKYIQEYVELFTELKNAKNYLNILSKEKAVTRFKDFNFYDSIFMTRQGGLTTANFEFYELMNHNVYSYDIKSSYPYQMIYKSFPVYEIGNTLYFKGENAQAVIDSLRKLNIEKMQDGEIVGFVGKFTLENVKSIFDSNILCISKAKLSSFENIKCVNGKVFSADKITLRLNEADFEGIKHLYSFSNIIAHEMYCSRKLHRINEAERFFLMKNFLVKENMKKDTVDYALSKVIINGMYGIKNQVEIKGYVDINNGIVNFVPFDEEKLTHEKREEVYNNFLEDTNINSNYDIFSDGMYIPAYAKLYLIETMVKLERDVTKKVRKIDKDYVCRILYCDTDSIKFTVKKKTSIKSVTTYSDISHSNIPLMSNIICKIFEKYNRKIIKDNEKFLTINCRNFISKYNVLDKDIKTLSKLGIFDCENKIIDGKIIPIRSFITTGAKKYGYIVEEVVEGKLVLKVVTKIAGCSTEVSEAIKKYSELEGITLEEALTQIFKCGTKFDESCSGRTTAYEEKHSREELEELGIIGAGGMHIAKTSYTLNITDDDVLTIAFITDEDYNPLDTKAPKRNINEDGILTTLRYR